MGRPFMWTSREWEGYVRLSEAAVKHILPYIEVLLFGVECSEWATACWILGQHQAQQERIPG